jgi:hypothetical protein
MPLFNLSWWRGKLRNEQDALKTDKRDPPLGRGYAATCRDARMRWLEKFSFLVEGEAAAEHCLP